MPGLSFVSLLAYDYRFLYQSLPSYYHLADEIILGLDCDRLTWMKQPFQINLEEVRAFIRRIDTKKKIRIAESDFHSAPHPLLNDTNERCLLAKFCINGNWIVQIDVDEILENGPEFKQWLLANQAYGRVVTGMWTTVYKAFGDQLLVIEPANEPVPVATMSRGHYVRARMTAQPKIASPLRLLHFSWGRSLEELKQKLENWGHKNDFDTEKFLDTWKSTTLENYQERRNLHPRLPASWKSLKLVHLSSAKS